MLKDEDYYIIKKSDVGKSSIISCVFDPLGIVLEQDVGKRCMRKGGIWYVENEEQFHKRTGGNHNVI